MSVTFESVTPIVIEAIARLDKPRREVVLNRLNRVGGKTEPVRNLSGFDLLRLSRDLRMVRHVPTKTVVFVGHQAAFGSPRISSTNVEQHQADMRSVWI